MEQKALQIESELEDREKTLIKLQNQFKIENEVVTRLRHHVQMDGFYETLTENEYKLLNEQII